MLGELGNKKHYKWHKVKMAIERDILCGKYPAGARIPTIEQIMEQYGIGRTSAQRVLDELAGEDLILRKAGTGCYVRPFVRERIKENHTEEAKENIVASVSYALDIDMSPEEIGEIISSVILGRSKGL